MLIPQDLRYAVRGLRRDPGFALVAIIILALGIGANTAVFSVVNPLLLRPLPFRDSGKLVWMEHTNEANGLSGATYRVDAFEEYRRHNRSFEDLSAYFAFFGFMSYKLTGSGEPERLQGVQTGPKFFEVLGVQPHIGRLFVRDEMMQNGRRGALLSFGLWQRRFASDPAIVGKAIALNDQAVTVVGVLPPDFDFSSVFAPGTHVDLYIPAILDEMRNWGNTLSVIGRLKPGTTIQSARAEFQILVPQLNRQHPEWGTGYGARLTLLKEHVSGSMHRSLAVLWCAVGLVLLIVCTNLSNLMLARTAARSRELAVRMALGAKRFRLVRQLLTEGLVLSAVGAVLGVPIAYALTRYLRSSATLSVPLLHRVEVDATVLGFTALIAIVTGLIFGAIPGLKVSGSNLQGALKENGRGFTEGRRHVWLRSALVVAEVTLACVLLVGSGLLLRSFFRLLEVNLGFQPTRAAAVRIDPSDSLNGDQRNSFLDEVQRRVEALPGIEAAGITDALPLDRDRSWGIAAKGETYPPGQNPTAFVYVVGPGYLQAMGIPLRAGRDFSGRDTAKSDPVVIVNETVARRLWPGQDAIGKIAMVGRPSPYRVIGIVADVRQRNLEHESALQMYLPYTQAGAVSSELVIRTKLTPSAMASTVRTALRSVDPNLVVTEFRPLDNLVDRATSPRRFLLFLLGGFASLAMLLACLGIYGVVSYTVNQRVPEIGIRMALGASSSNVRNQVIRTTLALAVLGILLGSAVSLALARLISSLLYETSPSDPLSFAATALILTIVAVLAGYIPSIRASRIDPVEALRGN